MIALLTNPPVPLALRIDLLKFRNPRPPPSFPDLIFNLHKIIANPESRAEEVKIAKRALLAAIGQSKQFSQAGTSRPSLTRVNPKSQDNNIATAQSPNYRKCHETNQN
jgi:hypothetical protein